jgi:hypothetical protein
MNITKNKIITQINKIKKEKKTSDSRIKIEKILKGTAATCKNKSNNNHL